VCHTELNPKAGNGALKYKDAGVDIDAAQAALGKIKAHIRSTFTKGVVTDVGLFAGGYSLSRAGLKDPILLSSIDGVGTKLKIAFAAGKFASVGKDIVAHCCNDILVHGADPIFFLDYVGMGKLDPRALEELVQGMAEECRGWGCALIGGETAEMPDMYRPGEFDLVGCVVGVVERNAFIDGREVREGDVLIGLPSTGLHTNGYSLARKVLLETAKYSLDHVPAETGCTLEESLLAPHRGYAKPVRSLLSKGLIAGMAHLTGGGFFDNIERVLPDGLEVIIEKGKWPVLPIFNLITKLGQIEDKEAYRTFNMGVGYVIFVHAQDADSAVAELGAIGEKAYVIGKVVRGKKSVRLI
jgi:phosphoribosylformylglycinamidine cyclo-ligase